MSQNALTQGTKDGLSQDKLKRKTVLCFNTVIQDLKTKKLVLIDNLVYNKSYNVSGIIKQCNDNYVTIDWDMKCCGNQIFINEEDGCKVTLIPIELTESTYDCIPEVLNPNILIDIFASESRHRSKINSTFKDLQVNNTLLKELQFARTSLANNAIADVRIWKEKNEEEKSIKSDIKISSIQIFQPISSTLFLLKYNKVKYLKVRIPNFKRVQKDA